MPKKKTKQGDNNVTAIMDDAFLTLSSWTAKNLRGCGHDIVSIKTAEGRFPNQYLVDPIIHEFPMSCGTMTSFSKINPISMKEVVKTERLVRPITAYFDSAKQMTAMVEMVALKFPDTPFGVARVKTRNKKTKDVCIWTREKKMLKSRKLELRLAEINGVSFREFTPKEIMKIADGLAHDECHLTDAPLPPERPQVCILSPK